MKKDLRSYAANALIAELPTANLSFPSGDVRIISNPIAFYYGSKFPLQELFDNGTDTIVYNFADPVGP